MPPRTLRHLSTPPHNHRNWVYRTDHLLAAKVSWRVTTLGLQERSTNAPVEQWNGCAQFESPTVRALNSSRPCLAAPAPETATESLRTRCAHTLEVDRSSGAGMPRVRRLVRVNGAPQGTVQCQLPDCDWLRLQFHTFFLACCCEPTENRLTRQTRTSHSLSSHTSRTDGSCTVYMRWPV